MSITNSQRLPKLMSIELVMPSDHFTLCHPLILLPSIFPSIRVFSYELAICYKEQYRIGTWNVKSMNQGKLEVIKKEVVRVNINILGISELKWTAMGEFKSDDHYIYYCGQESLRRQE